MICLMAERGSNSMKEDILYDESDIYYLNVIESLRQRSELQQTIISLLADDLRVFLTTTLSSMKGIPKTVVSNVMSRSLGSLIELVEILPLWAEINNESIDIKNESISLCSVVDRIHRWFSLAMSNKMINYQNNIDPNLLVCNDQRILEVVFKILILKIVRSVPDNGRIVLSAEQGECCTVVHIRCTGNGIDSVSLDAAGEGDSDLGLALCVSMLEEIEGAIRIDDMVKDDLVISVFLTDG